MADIRIRDVAPRLACQAQHAETEHKVELIDRLTDAGLMSIEVSSFVNPRLVPGLADAEQVFARVKRRPGVSLECCVGNLTGLKRAIDAGADAAWFLLAADEAFSRNNIGRTIEESYRELERMAEYAAGSATKLGTYVICAFGGPLGIARNPNDIVPMAKRLVTMGIEDWILPDSCGYAGPSQTVRMFEAAMTLRQPGHLVSQVHDSRGMGLANIAALASIGITRIDTTLAGSGGHPATPDAPVGGTCTEDVVQMLHLEGHQTGIELAALIEAANWWAGIIDVAGKGFVRRAGLVPQTPAEVEKQAQDAQAFSWSATN